MRKKLYESQTYQYDSYFSAKFHIQEMKAKGWKIQDQTTYNDTDGLIIAIVWTRQH